MSATTDTTPPLHRRQATSSGSTSHPTEESDSFLSRKDASPARDGDAEEVRQLVREIRTNLWQLVCTVTVSSARYLAAAASRRIGCLLILQPELVKDGRLPGSFANSTRAAAPAPAVASRSASWRASGLSCVTDPLAAMWGCARHIYCTGGSSAFFRGGRAYAFFLLASHAERVALGYLLHSWRAPSERVAQGTVLRSVWVLGVSPLLVSILMWPLRAVRRVVLTNFMADMVAPLGKHGDRGAPTASRVAEADGDTDTYLYSSAWEVWDVLRARMGWRGILGFGGFSLDLAHRYTMLGVYVALSVGLPRALVYAQRSWGEGRLLGHGSLVLGLSAVAALSNVLLWPFHVVAERMALLAPAAAHAGAGASSAGEKKGEEDYQRHGRRYRGAVHCARTVLAEEGVAGLYTGFGHALCMHAVGQVLQVLWTGKTVLAVPDFASTL